MSETTKGWPEVRVEAVGDDARSRCLQRLSTRRGIVGLLTAGVAALPLRRDSAGASPDIAGVTPVARGERGSEGDAPGPVVKSGDRSTPAPPEPLDFKEFGIVSGKCGYEIKHQFRRLFGLATRVPDKVCINDWVSTGAYGQISDNCKQTHDPQSICMHYNWGAHKVMGPVQWLKEWRSPLGTAFVLAEWGVTNWSYEEEATEYAVLVGSYKKTVTVKMSTTFRSDDILIAGKGTIDRDFDIGGRTRISYGVTGDYTADERQVVKLEEEILVPARTVMRVTMYGIASRGTYRFSHAISLDGYLGAQFSKRVDGHYHWAQHISKFLPNGTTQFKAAKGEIIIEGLSDAWLRVEPYWTLPPGV